MALFTPFVPDVWLETQGNAASASPDRSNSPSKMTVSSGGADFVRSWEKGPAGGAALSPYHSLEGGSDTVGWGHKMLPGEDYPGGLTAEQAERLFQNDLASHQRFVQKNVEAPLTQNQFDALTSPAYTAPGAFGPKTGLMTKLNQGDYAGAADEILRWDHVNHKQMPGLTARRRGEREMFVNGIYSDHQ
jgi:lysozyme